jgi:2-polyprenyl-3-methyl-5-hydroxy-6-metoxy-1,4-benzoquinol methylase
MDYTKKQNEYFQAERSEMNTYLKYHPNPKTVLDIGCGRGNFAAQLKSKFGLEAWGIEFVESEAKFGKEVLDKLFVGKIEDIVELLPDNYFDAVYFNDVLEHLENPYQVLENMKGKLSSEGIIISSIPNMRYFRVLKKLMFQADWKYESQGVMDYTHLRFFTRKSIKRMYEDIGYKIVLHEGINKTKSLQAILLRLIPGFHHSDTGYLHFITVVKR